jgi:amino acid adenylation domain-containing protein
MSSELNAPADYHRLLQDALVKIRGLRAEVAALRQDRWEPIAIVGAGCRFPGGVRSPDDYWRLLESGRDAITRIPQDRWDADAFYDPDPAAPGKMCVREGGFLDAVDGFDADFFRIPPREARQLDPQQRLLLEVSWEGLEDAGIAPDSLSGACTGVYVGVMGCDHAFRVAHHLDLAGIDPYMLSGNDLSFTAGRIAHYLGLQGPALAVATACSSSLVSLHLAAQALHAGECELALAGGVNVILDPVTGIMLSTLRALAPDGRSKTFDAAADGYGRGEGCGVLVLERLSAAVRNRRRILAVIRGSAVSHDGASAGLTVPNGPAQDKTIRKALAAAGVDAADIGYVEAHGTGTALGDPMEIQSLARVMSPGRKRDLLVGSVKTNIGHLEAAAGVAGVLKTALALAHRRVPAHLHFRTPNPRIAWNEIPLRVPVELTEWPDSDAARPRLAGVSSFGLSGVNAHVVLEEAPVAEPVSAADGAPHTLTLSARSPAALAELMQAYAAALASNSGWNWADVCYTSNTGRAHFEHRACITASTLAEGLAGLRSATRPVPDPASLAGQYLSGAAIDWAAHHRDSGGVRRVVALPTYPFQRQSYWALAKETAPEPANAPAVKAPADSLAGRLQELPSQARGAAVLEALARQVGAALGSATPADPARSLIELGLDSLMTVEIQAWLHAELGVELSLDRLHSSPSVEAVAQAVCALLDPSRTPTPTRDRAAPAPSRDRAAPAPARGPDPAPRRYPLSYGQEALWFIHESAPESPAYNVGVALRIASALDPAALNRALGTLASRHASLRATFSAPAGEPEQEIQCSAAIPLQRTDASAWDLEELKCRVAEAHRHPFQLGAGPVLRAELFTRSTSDHVLLLSMHHIACDALSFWTMIEEIQTAYAGGSLPPVRATYADFVRWQREMLAGPEGEQLWDFWRRQLAGEVPALNLPTDFPRPAVQTFHGASRSIAIGADLTRKLRDLARSQGATLHNTLLAVFAALLGRYAGQSEVVIGCATAGRPAGFAGVVGYFTNPIPVRVDLAEGPGFSTLLAQVRRTTFDGIEHQQMPFALLVQRLQPRRDPSRSPLYQADFSLLKPPPAYRNGAAGGTLPIAPFDLAEEEGQFDMGLHVAENEHDLTAVFKYNSSLFRPATIETMAACYATMLDAAASGPGRSIGALPLLSPETRRRLLYDGNRTQATYAETPVQRMFERQAQLTPDAIAAEMFGSPALASANQPRHTPDAVATETSPSPAALTYAELNLRANQLAQRLRELGVGPNVLVGLCIERSLHLVVAILAVLKAGGAYVPLDPTYPARRLEFMMSDAGMPVLLTTRELGSRFAVPEGIAAVRVDEEWPSIATRDGANPEVEASPAHLAYVIYTSGSSGLPKGTLIEHRGLTNYLNWCVEAYRVGEGRGAPVSSAIGFDATITSFFAPLITGGKVVMLPEDRAIESLAECLRVNRGFSLIKITPAHLEILSQLLRPEECAGCANAFVIGGEALRGDMLAFWREHAPGTRLINEYGPTETVVGCCVYEATDDLAGAVPIGRPIANTELYVLDGNMEPVPQGVVGELYIGGAGVARGYLNRPDLTEARFVADPFSGRSGARLFRSGDLVRLLPDGNLDFLGRLDSQVKIRGYRIELGEIESVLARHPGVDEAAVAVSGGQLSAWFTSRGPAPTQAEIRRFLADRLPAYMVPAFLVALDEFPLTPNGKIDRAALPAPELTRGASGFVAPREPLELKVAAVWERVLGIRPIGVKDNFFDLGGHSLLAVRLASLLEKETGQRVPLTNILRGPTVEQLAGMLRREAPPRAFSPLVPIQASGARPALFCVPGAGGNVIYLYNLARHLGPDQPFYGLQGVGFEGEAPPQRSVEEMAAHYLRAVESVQPDGPYFLGGHSLGGWVAYEMAQQLARRGRQVGLVAIVDTPVPSSAPNRDTSGWSEARWMFELAGRIGQLLNPDLDISLDALEALDGAAQLEYFRAALVGARLSPEEAGSGQIRNVLEMFKAHAQIRYRIPDRPLPVRIALLRTHSEPAGRPADGDISWGWSALAPTDVQFVPGEHLTTLRMPHVRALADRLSLCLDDAQRAADQTLMGKAAACPQP